MIASYLRKFDWTLFGSALALIGFGLVALYSTSLGPGGTLSENGTFILKNIGSTAFDRQAVFALVGIVVILLVPMFSYRFFYGAHRLLYALSIILLILVLLFGQTIRGTTGWFGIGGFGIQPVELVKFFLIVYLARFFSEYARDPSGTKQIIGSGIALAGVFFLVILQPDFGSALLLVATWGALLLASGIKKTHVLIMVGLCVVTALVAWMFVLKPYQKDRVAVFMDPSRDPLGKGYNVTQSIIAIGSGGAFGKGLGFGSQSQLRFLPERQTDFIFAVIAEELGFMGVLFLCALFGVFLFRCYSLSKRCRDDFSAFLVLGVMVSFAVEVFVNIGGNLRLLPMTGIALPLVSYGGSSLLAKCFMVGVLESVAVRQ